MQLSIVLAAWMIPESSIGNFLDWNRDAFISRNVEVVIVADHDYDLGKGERVVVYPLEQPVFSIPKTVNYGIRRASGDIIIKTDPDIIFSGEVLDQATQLLSNDDNMGMIGICANVRAPSKTTAVNWRKLSKRRRGRGALFALRKDHWFELNGYNENIDGWGGDDEEMWRRASNLVTMSELCEYPLLHVNHPLRKDRSEFFPVKSSRNLRIAKKGWQSEDWGDPLGEFKEPTHF